MLHRRLAPALRAMVEFAQATPIFLAAGPDAEFQNQPAWFLRQHESAGWPPMARRDRSGLFPISLALLAALSLPSSAARAQGLDSLAAHALQFAAQQLAASVAQVHDPSRFPRSTLANGTWRLEDSDTWTSGFFPGCLWLMHGSTAAAEWRSWATDWTAEMEGEKNDTGSHDIGFKIFCSFGNGYRLTGDPAWPSVIRAGAQSLSTRFNTVVGCTRSWNNRNFPVIIDNLMNLEILFWSARNGGDPAWYDMAVSHALRTRQDHVRVNGSTYHLVDYHPGTGAILSRGTVQGYSDQSTWARGQAWGLYGFTMAYRETGDSRFLETARLVADYFIDHLPADHVPYWDFDAPGIPNEPKDCSAAAIAASGLMELVTFDPDGAARARYRDAASDILASLCTPAYLAEGSNSSGILQHGVGNKPSNGEVDVSLIYGDYYFLEALLRYQALVTGVAPHVTGLRLDRAVPNPFERDTRIGFHLPAAGPVVVSIFDARGAEFRTLADGIFPAGEHVLLWDGRGKDGGSAASGIYFYRLRSGSFSQTRKVIRIR
jgi:unsaturated chondroitin disaccharide hydrolase